MSQGSEQRQYFIISSNGKSCRDTVVPLSPALGSRCHQGHGTQVWLQRGWSQGCKTGAEERAKVWIWARWEEERRAAGDREVHRVVASLITILWPIWGGGGHKEGHNYLFSVFLGKEREVTDLSRGRGILGNWHQLKVWNNLPVGLYALFQWVFKESPSRKAPALSCRQGNAEPSAAQPRQDRRERGHFILAEAKVESDHHDYPGGTEAFSTLSLYLIQPVYFWFLAYRQELWPLFYPETE